LGAQSVEDPVVVQAILGKWLQDLRTLTSDQECNHRRLQEAYNMALEPAQHVIATYYHDTPPEETLKRGRLFPIKLSIQTLAGRTWRARWQEQECSRLSAMLAQIRNHRRLVPVPRRLLRFIAGGCRRSLIATIVWRLVRCLYYSKGQCQPHGLCKASWIAEVFGVSVRGVKTARHELETLALLQRVEVPQWVLNRYGQKMTINLQWELPPVLVPPPSVSRKVLPPAPVAAHPDTYAASPAPVAVQPTAAGLIPPPEFSTLSFAPPDSDTKLSLRKEHQKPADGGPIGVLSALFEQAREVMREGTAFLEGPESVVMRTVSACDQQEPPPTPENDPVSLPAPILRNIVLQDLHDPGRLFALYEQAV